MCVSFTKSPLPDENDSLLSKCKQRFQVNRGTLWFKSNVHRFCKTGACSFESIFVTATQHHCRYFFSQMSQSWTTKTCLCTFLSNQWTEIRVRRDCLARQSFSGDGRGDHGETYEPLNKANSSSAKSTFINPHPTSTRGKQTTLKPDIFPP